MSAPTTTLSTSPQQRQTQSLALSPQIQQSLKILQAAALDLRAVIQDELQSNPTLEELPGDTGSISLEGAAEDAASAGATTGDTAGPDAGVGPAPREIETGADPDDSALPAPDAIAAAEDDSARDALDFSADGSEYDILQKLDQDWRDHMASVGGAQPHTADDAGRRQHFLDSLTSEPSLQEHLLAQAADLPAPPEKTAAAIRHLIGSLDDRGFLAQTPADIAQQTALPLENINDALRLLQTFEPAGIGARDIAECLLIQLAARNRAGDTLAARIIREHFDLLARRRVPELARQLDTTPGAIQSAIDEIASLDPAPARRFADDTNHAVIPDVTISKVAGASGSRLGKEGRDVPHGIPDDGGDGGWKITINGDYIPRLRISNTYRELIAKGTLTKIERDYVVAQMRSGKFLIDSIERRQQTIERIAREILRHQREFFDGGVEKLKPLTMAQIAAGLGVHETTIGRAIANKHVRTPHGVFEMRYFFPTGYQSAEGGAVSSTSVKEMLAALVAGEDRARPMSDGDLSGALRAKGAPVSRRTVTKYREELGIPASALRRDYAA